MKPESLSSNQKDGIRWIGGGKYSPSTSSGQAGSKQMATGSEDIADFGF